MIKKRLKRMLTDMTGKRLNLLYKLAPEKAVRKSLKLFISPRKGRVNGLQKIILSEAEHFKIKVDECALQAYYWPGGKKQVLLVHGWQSNSARWDELISYLRKENYSILALDAPAHGGSEGKEFSVPTYAKGIQNLAETYQPAFMIGHSIGGATLMFQMHKKTFPGLEKMVLMAPASELSDMLGDFQNELKLRPDLMRDLERGFEQKFNYHLSDFSMLKCTKEATVDALFIHDKTDKIVNWKSSVALVEQWANARLYVTRGFGHGLKDREVYRGIVEFLNSAH